MGIHMSMVLNAPLKRRRSCGDLDGLKLEVHCGENVNENDVSDYYADNIDLWVDSYCSFLLVFSVCMCHMRLG